MYKCDVTCSLPPLPLSQTVTPSRTPSLSPSSVTYFMDGPLKELPFTSSCKSFLRLNWTVA